MLLDKTAPFHLHLRKTPLSHRMGSTEKKDTRCCQQEEPVGVRFQGASVDPSTLVPTLRRRTKHVQTDESVVYRSGEMSGILSSVLPLSSLLNSITCLPHSSCASAHSDVLPLVKLGIAGFPSIHPDYPPPACCFFFCRPCCPSNL